MVHYDRMSSKNPQLSDCSQEPDGKDEGMAACHLHVIAIDTNGDCFDVHDNPQPAALDPNADGDPVDASGITDLQILYQRRLWNRGKTIVTGTP